jgi:hypothetical protein
MKKARGACTAAALALGLIVVATVGCVRVELPEAEYSTASDRIEPGDATELTASIDMGAGKLSVAGGTEDAMEAEYVFTRAEWRPEVEYDITAGGGDLSVRTPNRPSFGFTGTMRYEWDIRLTDELPLDLSVNMGAGQADLDMRGTNLTRLRVNLGAGDTTIDLSGDWDGDVEADVNAGAGKLLLRVPADVGVRIVGYQDGLGSYRADGFAQDGEALVNTAYEDAEVRFDIVLRRGLGDVTVETVK